MRFGWSWGSTWPSWGAILADLEASYAFWGVLVGFLGMSRTVWGDPWAGKVRQDGRLVVLAPVLGVRGGTRQENGRLRICGYLDKCTRGCTGLIREDCTLFLTAWWPPTRGGRRISCYFSLVSIHGHLQARFFTVFSLWSLAFSDGWSKVLFGLWSLVRCPWFVGLKSLLSSLSPHAPCTLALTTRARADNKNTRCARTRACAEHAPANANTNKNANALARALARACT
jgi:hypothetical protein